MVSVNVPLTLDKVINWARSGHESDKVYRFLFLRPDDFFVIPQDRIWSIAHQVVFNGDVCLLKRILALYSDDQIDIYTLSKDGKTLLDVAKEQRLTYPPMYDYVTHLFLQQDLMTAASNRKWDTVKRILNENPELSNEKPPYSTYFLIHYIIQNGNENILEEMLRDFQLQLNLLTADNETPLVLARRLRKINMCSILETRPREEHHPPLLTIRIPDSMPSPNHNKNNTQLSSTQHDSSPTNASITPMSSPSSPPYPLIDPFPTPSFSSFVLDLNGSGNLTVEKTFSFPISSQPAAPSTKQTEAPSTNDPSDQEKIAVSTSSELPSSSSVITPSILASNDDLRKHFTCPLTQRVFVDPVIASDGQTYERRAITEWVKTYYCSPVTGRPMDATFRDNSELKDLIDSMRQQS